MRRIDDGQRARAAAMLATGSTFRDVAKACGISVTSLWSIRKDPAFRALVDQMAAECEALAAKNYAPLLRRASALAAAALDGAIERARATGELPAGWTLGDVLGAVKDLNAATREAAAFELLGARRGRADEAERVEEQPWTPSGSLQVDSHRDAARELQEPVDAAAWWQKRKAELGLEEEDR